MAVIITHGTHDLDSNWWLETTPGDFADQLDGGGLPQGPTPMFGASPMSRSANLPCFCPR